MNTKNKIKIDWKDRVCLLTFNNPDTRNALDDEMTEAFTKAIQKIKNDSRARVLVITGMGDSFSAGGNLHMLLKWTEAGAAASRKHVSAIYAALMTLTELEIPTIAAINGWAVGVGASLPLLCDMRYAAAESKIGFTFSKLGLHPGLATEHFLTKIIGEARTFELLMTGDFISGDEAYRIGLVNRVFPADQLMDNTLKLAGKIAVQPVFPIRTLKQSIPTAMQRDAKDLIQTVASYQAICFSSSDLKEGLTAMIERRAPRFTDEY